MDSNFCRRRVLRVLLSVLTIYKCHTHQRLFRKYVLIRKITYEVYISTPQTFGQLVRQCSYKVGFLLLAGFWGMCQTPKERYLFEMSTQEPGISFLRMYFGIRIVVRRSVLDFTWLSMIAEIGGYVGLLLGIAVVDIAFALDRVWRPWAWFKRQVKDGASASGRDSKVQPRNQRHQKLTRGAADSQ